LRKPASNKKLLSLLSSGESGESFKFTPFNEALEYTIGWFLQNYDHARTGNIKLEK